MADPSGRFTTSLQGSPNDPGRPPVPGVCSHPPATHCDLPASSRRHPVGTIASMHVPEPAASGASKSPCVWTTFLGKMGIFPLLFWFRGFPAPLLPRMSSWLHVRWARGLSAVTKQFPNSMGFVQTLNMRPYYAVYEFGIDLLSIFRP